MVPQTGYRVMTLQFWISRWPHSESTPFHFQMFGYDSILSLKPMDSLQYIFFEKFYVIPPDLLTFGPQCVVMGVVYIT